MPLERWVHIIDDEARIRDSLAVLLSTAGIKSRGYGSAEEYLGAGPPAGALPASSSITSFLV